MTQPSESRSTEPLDIDWGDQRPIVPDSYTLLDRIVAVGMWGIGVPWLAAGMGACMLARKFRTTDEVEWLDRIYIRGQVLLTGSKWRAVVHPDVKEDQQYFFFQNHINHFDHVTMYNATRHFKQGIELEEHFKYPIYGQFMKQRGTIGVTPRSRDGLKKLMESVRSEIAAGHSILVFPEGSRTETGRVGPFKPGIFRIAMRVGVPIVPVTVTGMYDVMRKDSLVIRPCKQVTVYYDAPIPTAGLKESDLPVLMKRVHSVMAGRVDDYWRERGKLPR